MSDKTYLRDSYGPRVVDSGYRSEKSRGTTRQRDGDDKSKSKTNASGRPSKSDVNNRGRPSTGSSATSNNPVAPTLELDVIGQPPKSIVFGATVETSVMVSLRVPSPDMVAQVRNVDTSRFMAYISLVTDSRSGERVPLECGTLTGQNMFDSIHPVPQECVESLARSQPCRVALGYFSFPSMLIRQTGSYRLRVTLIRVHSAGSSTGGTSIAATDSDAIKVERRSTNSGNPRKHQRG